MAAVARAAASTLSSKSLRGSVHASATALPLQWSDPTSVGLSYADIEVASALATPPAAADPGTGKPNACGVISDAANVTLDAFRAGLAPPILTSPFARHALVVAAAACRHTAASRQRGRTRKPPSSSSSSPSSCTSTSTQQAVGRGLGGLASARAERRPFLQWSLQMFLALQDDPTKCRQALAALLRALQPAPPLSLVRFPAAPLDDLQQALVACLQHRDASPGGAHVTSVALTTLLATAMKRGTVDGILQSAVALLSSPVLQQAVLDTGVAVPLLTSFSAASVAGPVQDTACMSAWAHPALTAPVSRTTTGSGTNDSSRQTGVGGGGVGSSVAERVHGSMASDGSHLFILSGGNHVRKVATGMGSTSRRGQVLATCTLPRSLVGDETACTVCMSAVAVRCSPASWHMYMHGHVALTLSPIHHSCVVGIPGVCRESQAGQAAVALLLIVPPGVWMSGLRH